ncbi:hypothetical protein GCM10027515_16280 [Schumannella luteola]|uniref:histidine kinase n=1 Tax=Schumannella luteola TaxID=472059 RepID=A0A852YDG8_9MICO|nr:histidine kinase [Schumannella luteola]NYH00574.1 signal transduction histidine kinase [Schumannella luteola]TPX04962.1 hypothetical protein FJ656_09315 [Schumannella luteola]
MNAPAAARAAHPRPLDVRPAPPRRLGVGRGIAWGVFIAAGPLLNLVMQVLGWQSTPPLDRPDVSWVTLHAAVPFVFAFSAMVGLQLGERRLPIVMMALFPYFWIPQTFFAVVAYFGYVWPILRSIDLIWALLLGLIALAYPRGRYVGVVDWAVVGFGVSVSIVRAGVVLIADKTENRDCLCVSNAYALVGDQSTFTTVDTIYRVIGAVIVLFVATRLLWQWSRGSQPTRSVAFVMPIGLFAWTAALVAEAISYAMHSASKGAFVVAITGDGSVAVVSLFAVASVPICYIAGSVHLRNTRGRVADLMMITRDGVDRAAWRESLATVLRDPGVEVFWWDERTGGWIDDAGAPVEIDLDVAEPTSTLLPISGDGGTPIAVIRHDRALAENERLLDGVSAALRLSVDNRSLRSEVERTLAQVRESRQRIVEAGDEARKRLERDLHDGSQQQLVALAMELRTLVSAARAEGAHELAQRLEETLGRLSSALKELRELARGIHPTVLVEGGLALALPELASRCPVPTEVDVLVDERPTELVEATVYFVASECLANIARHSGARRAWVRLHLELDDTREVVGDGEAGSLVLTVRDNGRGGASLDAGTGIRGLVDRVEALGGELELASDAGTGTTVTVRLPAGPAQRD